jgi:hypothetical protein
VQPLNNCTDHFEAIDSHSSQSLRLTLGELDASTSTTQTVLFSLLHTRISREESAISQGWKELRIIANQSTSDAHAASACLTSRPTTGHPNTHVNSTASLDSVEYLQDGPTLLLVDKVSFKISTVYLNLPGTLSHANSRDRRFPTTRP